MSKATSYRSKITSELLAKRNPGKTNKVKKRMLLAAKIDKARENLDLSKSELAKKAGVQPSVVTKWLSGTHNFTTDTLVDLEKLLNIRLLDLEDPVPYDYKVVYKMKNVTARTILQNEAPITERGQQVSSVSKHITAGKALSFSRKAQDSASGKLQLS